MPIARIVTSMPELSGGLVRDLNSRGFEVHIISPEQTPSGTADLEIKLDAFSRPDGAEVPAAQVSAPTTFAVPESAISALQQLALQQPQEDIWTMLASFDGDSDTQDALAPNENRSEPASREAAATMHALNQNPQERSENPEAWSENSEARREISEAPSQIAQSEPAVIQEAATTPEREKPDSRYVDPDLVPSMFNFASFPENTLADQEAATSSNQSPWRGSELPKTNLRPWDARSHRVAAAAAGCAVLVVLMVLTFSHSRALTKAVSSPAPQTPTAVSHGAQASAQTAVQPAVPIKPAVLVSSVSSPSKATQHESEADTAVAEDTIVRYGSTKKAPKTSATKPSTIRYYSDMD